MSVDITIARIAEALDIAGVAQTSTEGEPKVGGVRQLCAVERIGILASERNAARAALKALSAGGHGRIDTLERQRNIALALIFVLTKAIQIELEHQVLGTPGLDDIALTAQKTHSRFVVSFFMQEEAEMWAGNPPPIEPFSPEAVRVFIDPLYRRAQDGIVSLVNYLDDSTKFAADGAREIRAGTRKRKEK